MATESAQLLTSATARIADDLKISSQQATNAIRLLEDGNTLPFIARYRKEATSGLTEQQLRSIQDSWNAFRELDKRRSTVLRTIDEQGKLTDALRQQLMDCDCRHQLEELYAPFRPKRRTRATTAREQGLQPLADLLLAQKSLNASPAAVLRKFVSAERGVADEAAALAGALDIVVETWADSASLREWMRERMQRGKLVSRVRRGKKDDGQTWQAWFDHSEPVSRVASHRFLAMKRGEAEGILRLSIEPDMDYVMPRLERRLVQNPRFEFAGELREAVKDCYKRLLQPAAETFMMQQLKTKADASAIEVFAGNVRELLLAPPAGPFVTIGIDPGFRTGCKVAVVDETGRYVDHATIYPTPPRSDVDNARQTLLQLIERHNPGFIAIGNGTASRETDAFAADLLRDHDLQLTKVMVSEAGASVYSASELAVKEYPDLDVTVRGAISIAHRLQDPLAELVKIDPKSVGVGQYQHDVNQNRLQEALDREVESSVSSVGVDVNLASPALLAYVPGIGPKLADNIVHYRNENGAFRSRSELLNVPKLGAKAFEQAAGFLRIRDGIQPLDNSAVHPEQYPLVSQMAGTLNLEPSRLIGSSDQVSRLNPGDFVNDDAGEFTIRDILSELTQPGRDPRAEFRAVEFDEQVREISDLAPGMKLEGVVTNVTRFGAFVDIGVHQDGLIHVSQLANHFVHDPAQEVSAGEIVRVVVLEVDEQRKRISLSRKDAK